MKVDPEDLFARIITQKSAERISVPASASVGVVCGPKKSLHELRQCAFFEESVFIWIPKAFGGCQSMASASGGIEQTQKHPNHCNYDSQKSLKLA
jgi:hypothetical protein